MSTQITSVWPSSWIDMLSGELGNFDQLGARPWGEISNVEFMPGVKVGDDEYVVPGEWLPRGGLRRLSRRSIALVDGHGRVISSDSEVGRSLRRSLVAMIMPRMTARGILTLKPSTWVGYAPQVMSMARWSIEHTSSANGTLWSHLSEENWREIIGNRSPHVAVRLRDVGLRGLLSDYPMVDFGVLGRHETTAIERSLRGLPAQLPKERPAPTQYKPLSDEFVTSFLSRALWVQANLAAQLIECWRLARDVTPRPVVWSYTSLPRVIAERKEIIASFDWRDANGRQLRELPWPWRAQKHNGKPVPISAWPPTDFLNLKVAIGLLQAMNFSVLAFCTGARQSEILAATDASLDRDHGRFLSRIFKVNDELQGHAKDWPLHPAALNALEIQIQLASVIRDDGEDHIWVTMRQGAEPGSLLHDANGMHLAVVRQLGLEHLLDGDAHHPHRWRYTVARLIALTITAAPQVLQDLFGHRDVEMTLRYMLSDPEIAQEALAVAEEAAYAVAEEAIGDVISGNAGGPAAEPLRSRLEALRMRRGEDTFSADTLRELTHILTFGGRYWELVRPGIICTKALGEYGPCTSGRGRPDPGACRTGCDHRLESGRARRDCEELLNALLAELAQAYSEGLVMLIANLEGQVLASLKRWPEVRERILSSSPNAKRIWEAAHGA